MRTTTFGDGDDDLDNPVVSLAMRLPIATPILPAGIEKAELGELTTDERYAENPSRAAPTFLREASCAQQRLLPFDAERASVFYSPTDGVSARAKSRSASPNPIGSPTTAGTNCSPRGVAANTSRQCGRPSNPGRTRWGVSESRNRFATNPAYGLR
jgi:hypothetical protein